MHCNAAGRLATLIGRTRQPCLDLLLLIRVHSACMHMHRKNQAVRHDGSMSTLVIVLSAERSNFQRRSRLGVIEDLYLTTLVQGKIAAHPSVNARDK